MVLCEPTPSGNWPSSFWTGPFRNGSVLYQGKEPVTLMVQIYLKRKLGPGRNHIGWSNLCCSHIPFSRAASRRPRAPPNLTHFATPSHTGLARV